MEEPGSGKMNDGMEQQGNRNNPVKIEDDDDDESPTTPHSRRLIPEDGTTLEIPQSTLEEPLLEQYGKLEAHLHEKYGTTRMSRPYANRLSDEMENAASRGDKAGMFAAFGKIRAHLAGKKLQ